MPGLVKVGLTTDSVEARLTQISSATGVPLPFECYFAAEVDDAARVEGILQKLFSEHRINPKREFFRVDPEKVVLAISIGQFTEITPGEATVAPEERGALQREKQRRPDIRLSALGVLPGAILTFSRDAAVTATVVAENKVSLNGEVLSLSAAALKVLSSMGYKSTAASGSMYWSFEDELLDERLRGLEPLIEIDCADDGLKGVGEDDVARAPHVLRLPL